MAATTSHIGFNNNTTLAALNKAKVFINTQNTAIIHFTPDIIGINASHIVHRVAISQANTAPHTTIFWNNSSFSLIHSRTFCITGRIASINLSTIGIRDIAISFFTLAKVAFNRSCACLNSLALFNASSLITIHISFASSLNRSISSDHNDIIGIRSS
jgi:hypothetical protein